MQIGEDSKILLRVSNLRKYFPVTKGLARRQVGTIKAVDQLSFRIRTGEAFGLVGESGCGKTTTGRVILRAIEPTSGVAFFDPSDGRPPLALFDLDKKVLKRARRHMRMIFQDPYSSLNPRMNVREIVCEPLRIHKVVSSRSELDDRVAEALRTVGLDASCMPRYPHAFSGGQRQRLCIARALVLKPRFIVADEPVSALDVSVQAQILNLMQDLQAQFSLTYLFIAHNLAVVEHFCDRVAVMYAGRLVELADTEELFQAPQHPYTEALLNAVPRSEPGAGARRGPPQGEVADPVNPPRGCHFHPRCRYAQSTCRTTRPQLQQVPVQGGKVHLAACHLAEQLDLAGVTA